MSDFSNFKSKHKGAAVPAAGTLGSHFLAPGGSLPDNYVPDYAPFKNGYFPKGHQYASHRTGKAEPVEARYKTGDDWMLAGRSPEEIAQVQLSMVRAGLLKPGKFQSSQNDAATRAAFRELLGEANATGIRWGDMLDQKVAISEATGGPDIAGSTRQPLSIQLSNPDTIKQGIEGTGAESATSILGSRAAAGDPQHYADEINAQETKQQTDQYNQTGENAAGGTTYDPATAGALLAKEHPAEAAVNGLLGSNAQAFINTLGGGAQAGMT